MAYCVAGDLVLGGIPTPVGIDASKIVSDAADEIDSQIGMRYATPIDTSTSSTIPRPIKLLLKRINVALASGRLILAADSNGENQQLHAYGLSLINEAGAALKAIAAGEMVLTGVDPSPDYQPTVTTPLIDNLDAESAVEAFYGRVANPGYFYPGVGPYSDAEGGWRYGTQQGMVR